MATTPEGAVKKQVKALKAQHYMQKLKEVQGY